MNISFEHSYFITNKKKVNLGEEKKYNKKK